MNLNSMLLTNIRASPYFKMDLFELKTFHEVVDEIYYKVEHLEPWEKNSRKLAGQVGMCAGVRGVGAGGIVSTAYCILYKLFTLKLTRRQLKTMLNHHDSPYIRGIGFMYIRYCQPPFDFWDWYEPYINDEEEIDLKAGSGYTITIGEVVRTMMTKLDWFGTLFPRMPVNVQRELEDKIRVAKQTMRLTESAAAGEQQDQGWEEEGNEVEYQNGEEEEEERDNWRTKKTRELPEEGLREKSKEKSRERSRERERSQDRHRDRSREKDRPRVQDRSKDKDRGRDRSKDRGRDRSKDRARDRSRDKDKQRGRSRERKSRETSRERQRSSSPKRSSPKDAEHVRSHSKGKRQGSRSRSRERCKKSPKRSRSVDRKRSRSRERHHRSSSRGKH
eukprot:Em0016g163a